MKTSTLTAAAFLICFGLGTVCTAADHTKDSLETVQANLKEKKAVLVDVREVDEWKEGHLQGAMSVPLSFLKKGADSPELAGVLAQQIPKNQIMYAHCVAGGRCLAAADLLAKMGYEVRPLKAGYDELARAGFPKAATK